MAAVQARIAQIQSQFPATVVARPAAGAPGATIGTGQDFNSVLASSQAALTRGPSGAGRSVGDDVVATAQKQLGVKYGGGGESVAEGGFE
jgi:cell wall-associated NlpC family hydrolase